MWALVERSAANETEILFADTPLRTPYHRRLSIYPAGYIKSFLQLTANHTSQSTTSDMSSSHSNPLAPQSSLTVRLWYEFDAEEGESTPFQFALQLPSTTNDEIWTASRKFHDTLSETQQQWARAEREIRTTVPNYDPSIAAHAWINFQTSARKTISDFARPTQVSFNCIPYAEPATAFALWSAAEMSGRSSLELDTNKTIQAWSNRFKIVKHNNMPPPGVRSEESVYYDFADDTARVSTRAGYRRSNLETNDLVEYFSQLVRADQ